MIILGDVKWAQKQTGERTVRKRKAGVAKGQGWEQGASEEQREGTGGVKGRTGGGGGKERKRGRENDDMPYHYTMNIWNCQNLLHH